MSTPKQTRCGPRCWASAWGCCSLSRPRPEYANPIYAALDGAYPVFVGCIEGGGATKGGRAAASPARCVCTHLSNLSVSLVSVNLCVLPPCGSFVMRPCPRLLR